LNICRKSFKIKVDYLDINAEKMATINAAKKNIITHIMLLATAALLALLDMKPASAKDFTKLFFILAVGSTTLT
jgi:hypothetical protein